ncbi:MAG TPA: TIGR02677 family protein, partial [Oxalobacteraceae bacterium]|nr:TIGR02677 family protein [Oxalobacteraceae bacterium]
MIESSLNARDLFRHVSADKAQFYRVIMETFAAAKRQFRLHLRPDEVQIEADWQGAAPPLEEIQLALSQLAEWGNLESQPDTARVSSIEDFYRARFLYRLSIGGEAVEAALAVFAQALKRRGELQTIALEDIFNRLEALLALAEEPVPDAVKVHEVLRDLVRVFEGLADNAQAFMAGVARTIELQQADIKAVLAYKQRLIDYLERFIGDLVARSG